MEKIDDLDDDVSHLLRLDVEWTRVEKPKKKILTVIFFSLYIIYKLY